MNKDRYSRDVLLKNIMAMRTPTPLLKFGATGKPQFRNFSISADGKFLQWEGSKKKSADEARGGDIEKEEKEKGEE